MNIRSLTFLLIASLLLNSMVSGQVTPGDTIHAVNYSIDIKSINFDDNEIDAVTTVSLTPLVDGLDIIQLQLMQLSVDSVYVNGMLNSFTHANELINIPLTSTISIGDTVDVRVVYHGEPFHESWGGFHWSGEYAFNLGVGISWIPHNLGKTWFPCIDDFTDRATYEVIATVPGHMTAVAGGELIEVIYNFNGTNTYRWFLDNPIPTYLASVAIGKYYLVEDLYAGIERDIPITYYVIASDTLQVEGTFSRMHEILNLFENQFGAYDWNRVGYVGTSIGAMEHATNIAYPNFAINGGAGYEDLYAHELFHMWFGDKITCDKAEEMWINEGWATFAANYYVEVLDGVQLFTEQMRDMHADVLYGCHTEEGGYHPLNDIPQSHTYGTSAYDRGATIVQALRSYLGDEIFFEACKDMLEELAFTSISSYDMEANLTQNTGIDMSGFFNNWVYHGGHPHYSIDSFNVVPSGSDYDVTVYVKQKRHGPEFVGDGNIIGFTATDANWVGYPGIVDFDGLTGSATITVPEEPVEVFLDLEERYMDATIDNSMVITEVDEYSFPSTYVNLEVNELSDPAFIQVTHNYAPADTFAVPVPDLRVSDYRYWTLRGVLPENFDATARFFYSKGGLDNSLIFTQSDSVVILYREDAGMEWQALDFTVLGSWSIGYIFVENAQMGDYTLAVWDISVSTEDHEAPKTDNLMQVYPNPSSGTFTFELNTESASSLDIYSINGELIDHIPATDNTNILKWIPDHVPSGTYLAILNGKQKRILSTRKIIYNN